MHDLFLRPFAGRQVNRFAPLALAVFALACERSPEVSPEGSKAGTAMPRRPPAAPAPSTPDPAPMRADEPLRVGGDISRPLVVRRVAPNLPDRLHRVGPLILEAVIDETGKVESVVVLRDGNEPPLGPLWADALRQWTFTPAMHRGKPVRVTYTLKATIHPQ